MSEAVTNATERQPTHAGLRTVENCPMVVQSRGRLYTDERHRRRLGVEQGDTVYVQVNVVDRTPAWGVSREVATFEAPIQYYGEVQIPQAVRRYLDLVYGDTVRVTFAVES